MKTYIISCCLFLFSACEKLIFSDPGPIQRNSISFDYFSQISVYDIFEIELGTDSIFSVEIETFKKYIENISFVLDSGNLEIEDNNNFKGFADYPRPKLKIKFPRIDNRIILEAPAKITTKDTLELPSLVLYLIGQTGELDITLNVDYFRIVTDADNYGYYLIQGKANSTNFWPRGSSQIDASQLISQYCYVYNNSIGDCYVNVSQKLEVRLNTIGNVIYSGNPKEIVIIEKSGTGKVFPANK